jgi:hypothetical protein
VESNPGQKEYVRFRSRCWLNNEYVRFRLNCIVAFKSIPTTRSFQIYFVWYFVQKKISPLHSYMKALDKRNREDGNRIFHFAQSAFDEGYYDGSTHGIPLHHHRKGKVVLFVFT